MVAMSQESRTLVEQIQNVPDDERPAVAAALRPAMKEWIPEDNESRKQIWMVLIIGSFVIALGCLAGAIFLANDDKDATALFAAVTGIVGLVIGLFSSPPGGTP